TSTAASPGTLTISAGANLNLSSGSTKSLYGGRILQNNGTATWSGGHIALDRNGTANPTTFNNAGTFTISAGGGVSMYNVGGSGGDPKFVSQSGSVINKETGAPTDINYI